MNSLITGIRNIYTNAKKTGKKRGYRLETITEKLEKLSELERDFKEEILKKRK